MFPFPLLSDLRLSAIGRLSEQSSSESRGEALLRTRRFLPGYDAMASEGQSEPQAHHRRHGHHHNEGILKDPNFIRFMRFGIADQAILMLCLLGGFSVDAIIARRIGVAGYGTIVGASIGNVFADGLAGLPSDGLPAALGVTAGCLLPIIPLFAVLLLKRPLNRSSQMFVGGSAVALLAGTTVWNLTTDVDSDDDSDD